MTNDLLTVLERIADNTTPRRRMLQRFGDLFVDPAEIVAVQADGILFLSSGQQLTIPEKDTEELLSYLSLDS